MEKTKEEEKNRIFAAVHLSVCRSVCRMRNKAVRFYGIFAVEMNTDLYGIVARFFNPRNRLHFRVVPERAHAHTFASAKTRAKEEMS